MKYQIVKLPSKDLNALWSYMAEVQHKFRQEQNNQSSMNKEVDEKTSRALDTYISKFEL